jgi:hypothetical protein
MLAPLSRQVEHRWTMLRTSNFKTHTNSAVCILMVIQMSVDRIIRQIDWELLNKQRLILAELSMSPVTTNEQQEALEGVVNLLDELCDARGVS